MRCHASRSKRPDKAKALSRCSAVRCYAVPFLAGLFDALHETQKHPSDAFVFRHLHRWLFAGISRCHGSSSTSADARRSPNLPPLFDAFCFLVAHLNQLSRRWCFVQLLPIAHACLCRLAIHWEIDFLRSVSISSMTAWRWRLIRLRWMNSSVTLSHLQAFR